MKTELKKFYALIDEIEVAMMTTRRPDGHLESRAMANQKPAAGADLWFVTADATAKVRDLETGPPYQPRLLQGPHSRMDLGIGASQRSGANSQKIRELYAPRLESCGLESEGDPRHGTPDDPRIVLIGVDIQAAAFLEVNKPRPVVLYELVKGWMTGDAPELGEMHTLEEPHRA